MMVLQKIKAPVVTLLLWIQKYTKTDMLYLAKGAFWFAIIDLAASLSSFVLAIAYANFLPQQVFGQYKYVLSIVGILGIFSLSGLSTALTGSIAKGYDGTLLPVLKTFLKWSTLSSVGAMVAGVYYFSHGNTAFAYIFFILAIILPFKDAFTLVYSYLEGKRSFDTFSKINVIGQVVTTILLILVIYFSQNILYMLFAYFIPKMCINFFYFRKVQKTIPKDAPVDTGAITYGKHLSFLNILITVAEQIDKIMIGSLLGAAPLAIYSFALAPQAQIRSAVSGIFPLAFPKFAKSTPENLKQKLPHKVFLMFIVIVAVVGVYVLAAPLFFHIFFEKYSASVIYSQVAALALIFLPRGLMSDAITAQGHIRKLYVLSLSNSILKILLYVTLIYFFALWGAIAAFIFSECYAFLMSTFLFKRL